MTRFFAVSSFVTVILLVAAWGNAAEMPSPKPGKCLIVYINGEVVIKCPRPVVILHERT